MLLWSRWGGKKWLFGRQHGHWTAGLWVFIYRPTRILTLRVTALTASLTSLHKYPLMWPWIYCDESTQMRRTYNVTGSFTADERILLERLSMHHIYTHIKVMRWWLPVKSEWQWRAVDTGVECLCFPSLNSPRSNLQTAAEFWQILPWCLLPLGDTFFYLFSPPPIWYSLWPLKLLSVLFSIHVWETKWIYRVYSQPLPFSGLLHVA